MATKKGKSVKTKANRVPKGAKSYGTIKDGKVKFKVGGSMDRGLHARGDAHTHVKVGKGGKKRRTRYDSGTKTSKKS